MRIQRRWLFLDALWLSLLALYVLAGTHLVPLHGDESTIIWTSKDYAYILLENGLDRVRYSESPVDASEQQLRLLNGSLTRYLIGFSWHLNGYTIDDINEQWHWGFDWQWNLNNGHIPDDTLLMFGRWPSALLFAAGSVPLFLIGLSIYGRPVAYLATFYYATNPALLLNGRRAMFEGPLIFFTLMTLLAGIWFLQRRSWWSVFLLGICAGLTVSAKHTGVLTAGLVVAAVTIFILYHQWQDWQVLLAALVKLVVTGIVTIAIFFALHPVWWGNPFERADQVLDERQALLETQVDIFGGYADFSDRIGGFWRQVFIAQPQYYEAQSWSAYIADQINGYESSVFSGLYPSGLTIMGVILVLLSIVGFWTFWRRRNEHPAAIWVIGLWASVTFVILCIITPVEWQRYYLQCYLAVGLLSAVGMAYIVEQLFDGMRSR